MDRLIRDVIIKNKYTQSLIFDATKDIHRVLGIVSIKGKEFMRRLSLKDMIIYGRNDMFIEYFDKLPIYIVGIHYEVAWSLMMEASKRNNVTAVRYIVEAIKKSIKERQSNNKKDYIEDIIIPVQVFYTIISTRNIDRTIVIDMIQLLPETLPKGEAGEPVSYHYNIMAHIVQRSIIRDDLQLAKMAFEYAYRVAPDKQQFCSSLAFSTAEYQRQLKECNHFSADIINFMFEKQFQLNDHSWCCLLHSVVTSGHLDVIKFITTRLFMVKSMPFDILESAAKAGVETVHYIYSLDPPLTHGYLAYDKAAQLGNLEVIKYLHQHCPNVEPGKLAADCALKNGHEEVARYLIDNCIFSDGDLLEVDDIHHSILTVDLLKYLINSKNTRCRFSHVVSRAVGHGLKDVFDFLINDNKYLKLYTTNVLLELFSLDVRLQFDWPISTSFVDLIMGDGFLKDTEMLALLSLLQDDSKMVEIVVASRASLRYRARYPDIISLLQQRLFKTIKVLHEYQKIDATQLGSHGDTTLIDCAVQVNSFESILLLHGYQGEAIDKNLDRITLCTAAAAKSAAVQGNLEILKYLVGHFPKECKSPIVLPWAARGGHLGTVKYLIESNQTIFDVKESGILSMAIDMASSHNNLEVLKYLYDYIQQQPTRIAYSNNAIIGASEGGHLDVFKFLVDHKIFKDNVLTECFAKTIHFGGTELAKYCVQLIQPDKESQGPNSFDSHQQFMNSLFLNGMTAQIGDQGNHEFVIWAYELLESRFLSDYVRFAVAKASLLSGSYPLSKYFISKYQTLYKRFTPMRYKPKKICIIN